MEQPCQLNSFSEEYSAWAREGKNYGCIFFVSSLRSKHLHSLPNVATVIPELKNAFAPTGRQQLGWGFSIHCHHLAPLSLFEPLPLRGEQGMDSHSCSCNMDVCSNSGGQCCWPGVPSYASEAPSGAARAAGPESDHVLVAETACANCTHVLLQTPGPGAATGVCW